MYETEQKEKRSSLRLDGRSFSYCGKEYHCSQVAFKMGRYTIYTDKRTFIKTESEYNAFLDDIKLIQKKKMSEKQPESDTKNTPSAVQSIKAEIIESNSVNKRMSDSLMEVFETLSKEPKEEDFKKADAMVKVANAIVGVQMAQFKYLSLKK